jgi:hypothetical protein
MERELDGVRLDNLVPGAVREVSASVGSWLIIAGYAEPEMRRQPRDDYYAPPREKFQGVERRHVAHYSRPPAGRNPFLSRK